LLFATLLELETFLGESKTPISGMLNPGISAETAKGLLGEIEVPQEVLQLYSWRNGVYRKSGLALGEQWLLPMGIFLPLDIAVNWYKKSAASTWGTGRFPLFASWGRELFLLECQKESEKSGMVYYYDPEPVDSPSLETAYDSLSAMFQTILECYRQKVYYYHPITLQLVSDFWLARDIAMPLNPRSEFWRSIVGP
jgi:hypothetical protein